MLFKKNKGTKQAKTVVKKPAPKRQEKTVVKKPAPKKQKQPKKKDIESFKEKVERTEKRDEFRKNRDSGHPSYIYMKVGNKYKYIGLTHSKVTNKTNNIELEHNPNPNDTEKSYATPYTRKAKTKRFKGKEDGWKFSEEDKPKINEIIEKEQKKRTK